jgi:transposase-like protein
MERRRFTREFKLEAVRLIKSEAFLLPRPRTISACINHSCAVG